MTGRAGPAAVGAAALFTLAVWASTSGSVRIWHEAPDDRSPVAVTTPVTTLPSTVADATTNDSSDGFPWIIETLLLLALLGVVILAAFVLRGSFALKWRRRDEDKPPLTVLPDLADVMTEDAEAQRAALASGSPRNAIVACWVRLEDAVASAGLAPNPAETSAELTARVLSTYPVGRAAIEDLARLYREARFSEHELGEEQRNRAIAALGGLHSDLASRRVDAEAAVRAIG